MKNIAKLFVIPLLLVSLFAFASLPALATGPVKPYSFSAVPGKQSGSVDISWFDDPHADRFNLLYGTTPNSTSYGVINLPDVPFKPNTLAINYLTPGQTYYFTLIGITNGTTEESGPVSAQAANMENNGNSVVNQSPNTASMLQFGFQVTNGSKPGTANLTWTDNGTAGKYDVVYGTTPGNYVYGVENLPTVPNQTNTYTIGALKSGTRYYFALVAERNSYVISWTNPVSIVAR